MLITVIIWIAVVGVAGGLVWLARPLILGTAQTSNTPRPETDQAYGDRVTSGRPRRQ